MRAIICLPVAALSFLMVPADALAASSSSETYRQLNLFGDVFERVRTEYVEEVTDETLVEAAINGMLTSLDPHSSYLNKKNYQDMQVQTRGEFGGLGIEVTMENGLIKVVSPIDDTPAHRAGMQPGDMITHLNAEPVLGMSLGEAVEKMRGPPGTDIKVTVRREGENAPFDVTITRAVIKIQSVRQRVEDDIGYVRLTAFNDQTQSGLERAIEQIRKENGDRLKGFVLDLRNNPGGLLEQAVFVADSFLERGEIVSTRGRRPEEGQRFNAKPGDLAAGLPLVVLINGGSASASEIVAGALQDHRRAIVLGTQSFGKGSVQTIIPLPGHGAMRLTTARYYTPSGRSIQQLGIAPDIEVPAARVELLNVGDRRREADLKGALGKELGADANGAPAASPATPAAPANPGTPNGAKGAPAPGNGAAPAAPPAAAPGEDDEDADPVTGATADGKATPVDYQLLRAKDLIKGVWLFRGRVAN